MTTNRILDTVSASEETVVQRTLITVHRVIDEKFPEIAQTNRQFTKTVISEDDNLNTPQYPSTPTNHSSESPVIKTDKTVDVGRASSKSTKKAANNWGLMIAIAALISGLIVMAYLLMNSQA